MRPRLDVLDGMRGFAILLVVLYHSTLFSGFRLQWPIDAATPAFSLQWLAATGFIGVELFFFISGFCLFYPYARHVLEGRPKPTVLEFAFRRFIKIVPSYVIALTALAILFHADYNFWPELVNQYLLHLFFLHGISPSTFYGISGPLWTLAIEVQFYVLFPLLAGSFMRWPVATWAALGLIAIADRAWVVAHGLTNYTYYGQQLGAMIDLFATGMLGAYLYVRWRPFFEKNARARIAATLMALAGAAGGAFLLQQLQATQLTQPQWGYYSWQMAHRTEVALVCLEFTLASAFGLGAWRGLVANPILVWLSIVSYNLYLWHDGIIIQCHDHGFPCAFEPTPWVTNPHWIWLLMFGSIAWSVWIASAMTYLVERPLLRLRPAWVFDRASRGFPGRVTLQQTP